MIIIAKIIDYTQEQSIICMKAVEITDIYLQSYADKNTDKKIQYKINDKWFDFDGIRERQAVLPDSLFSRYMYSSLTRIKNSDIYSNFLTVRTSYNVTYRNNEGDEKGVPVSCNDLRNQYYKDGIDYTFIVRNRKGEEIGKIAKHFVMLMRNPSKAKKGECIFIEESLFLKAIRFLTMGLYDKMKEQYENAPDTLLNIVGMSAYQTLTTAAAGDGYIQIPLNNILIIKDREVLSDPMKAAVVKSVPVQYRKFEIDFDDSKVEKIINRHDCTFDPETAKEKGYTLIGKSREDLSANSIRVNGKYPREYHYVDDEKRKQCTVVRVDDYEIPNILWDGQGLCDSSIMPEGAEGFIYFRSHFFKSCLFAGNIQEFFKDYCVEHGIDYKTATTEKTDMFKRKLKLRDIKAVISDKSIKWLKFVDLMGGKESKAFRYWRNFMKEHDNWFEIVKTVHQCKLGEYQKSAYQMNNSVPSTDRSILQSVANCSIEYYNLLKNNDAEYLKYLEMMKNRFNINEVLLAMVGWNSDFTKTELFREKKSKDLNKLKNEMMAGRLWQKADNLTIMDNPISMLLTAVGDKAPLNEECFSVMADGVQCYTPKFKDGERLAAFRNPHNSPNNIIHLYNVYPEKLLKYFPDIGENVIVFNAIGTDTQARLNSQDCDSDFVYVTNQSELAELARTAYVEYPTIINAVEEKGVSEYHFCPEDFAKMDNAISAAQISIGVSTDLAQMALSYYYAGKMKSRELEDIFIILSVIGQISIDLAKKNFDINVVNEINRIKRLSCMKSGLVARFMADAKKIKNPKKKYSEGTVQRMNCPMDIMAEIIEEETIQYPDRVSRMLLRDLFDKDLKKIKADNRKIDNLVELVRGYNDTMKDIRTDYGLDEEDKAYYELKNRVLDKTLKKFGRIDKDGNTNLDQIVVAHLTLMAMRDSNSDVRNTILNFLYQMAPELLLKCFVKNEQKAEENLQQNDENH